MCTRLAFQSLQGAVSGDPRICRLCHLADPVLRADRQRRHALGGHHERQHDGAGAVQRHRAGHHGRHDTDPAAQVSAARLVVGMVAAGGGGS